MTDYVYSNRFKHVPELVRMGAKMKVEGRSAIIEGGHSLAAAKVKRHDLRAGAALVVAALTVDRWALPKLPVLNILIVVMRI